MTTVDIHPEFGIELALGLPYVYWLHENNQLEKVVTSKGMKPFYYFCDNVEERYDYRTIDNSAAGLDSLPNPWIYGNKHNAQLYKDDWILWKDFMCEEKGCGILDYRKWKVPDFTKQYKNNRFLFNKPFIVVSNRYNWEHGTKPVGYFDIKCLYEIFNYLTEKGYLVIYKRPKNTEFPPDQNEMATLHNKEILSANVDGIGEITDHELTNYYEDVILFDDIVKENNDLTYNEVQLKLFANADKFVAMSGGSTLLLNLFKKPTITYLYNSSDLRENFWESKNGNVNIKNYYYMMNPNVIPFVDENCVDMKNAIYYRFLNLIKENI
mgnify:FL=1|tara:strand:+ start:2743 stop:3714 length:972 start_codon:yes stop_codon:yes gene_type:complete